MNIRAQQCEMRTKETSKKEFTHKIDKK